MESTLSRIKNLSKKLNDKLFIFSEIGVNKIILDACSICQLKCSSCYNSEKSGGAKPTNTGWGYLKFNDFKKFIDENPEIKHIEFSSRGEVFLNPELDKIIKYGFIKKIVLSANNGVNFNDVKEKVLEYLVKYKFKAITFSIDGASNDTYKIYRKGGNFDNVIMNITKLNEYKKKYNSNFPELTWQFVIFGHNEHELPIAKKIAKELNMEFKPKLNWSSTYSPIKNKEVIKKESGLNVSDRKEFKKKNKKEYILPCFQLWKSPIINWDGKLIGCCLNFNMDFGNVFEKGLDKCLKNKKYIYTKKFLIGKKKLTKKIPCFYCSKKESIFKKNIIKRGLILK